MFTKAETMTRSHSAVIVVPAYGFAGSPETDLRNQWKLRAVREQGEV